MAMHWLKSEEEILRRITADRQLLANAIYFALNSAFPHPCHPFAQDVLVAINVKREVLGLLPNRKPGDIDLLLVPFKDGPLLQQTIAIEAKIVRPTVVKPSRNVNSMGRRQALGLLEDGFPFVGLLHISIPEPLPEPRRFLVPLMGNEFEEDGRLQRDGKYISMDPFPLASACRQEGRLKSLGLPSTIAFKSIGFSLAPAQDGFGGFNVGEERYGERNPRVSGPLIDRLRELVEERDMFQLICWYVDGCS